MKVLLAKTRIPYPIRAGQDLVDYGLIRALSEAGEVTLVAFAQQPVELTVGISELRKYCSSVISIPYPRRVSYLDKLSYRIRSELLYWFGHVPLEATQHWSSIFASALRQASEAATYDFAEVTFWHLGSYTSMLDGLSRVLMQHDSMYGSGSRFQANNYSLTKRLRHYYWRHTKMSEYETEMCRRFDWISYISARDMDLIRGGRDLLPRSSVMPVPYCINAMPSPPDCELQHLILFIGGLHAGYNVDSIMWFKKILPMITRRVPGARLCVAGAPAGASVMKRLADEAIDFAGFVPDISPLLAQAAVCVVPVVSGSGIRTKIIEFMARGKAIVSTTMGAEGLEVVDGEDILLASSEEEFADKVVDVLLDMNLRRRIGGGALERFRRSYSYSAVKEATIREYARIRSNLGRRGIGSP